MAPSTAAVQRLTYDEDGNLIGAFVAADMNCDGTLDSFDIDPFVLALTDPSEYEEQYPDCDRLNGDLDGDGDLDSTDLNLFTALLSGFASSTGLRVEYTWNAENRLTAVTPVSPQAGDKKVEFAYDYMGRRVQKQVFDWDDVAEEWESPASLERRFVWAGWLMLAELDDNNDVVRTYTWGLDLSQTLTGAGGTLDRTASRQGQVGGLLAVCDGDEQDDYVYLHDVILPRGPGDGFTCPCGPARG